MTTNNNNHTTTNEILWIKQIHFIISKVSVVFDISSSHSKTNLLIRHFWQE